MALRCVCVCVWMVKLNAADWANQAGSHCLWTHKLLLRDDNFVCTAACRPGVGSAREGEDSAFDIASL